MSSTASTTHTANANTLSAKLRALVAEAGAKGLSPDEAVAATQAKRRPCLAALSRMVGRTGALHVGGKHYRTRYFINAEMAKAYTEAMPPTPTEQAQAGRKRKATQSNILTELERCGASGADAIELQAKLPQHALLAVYQTLSRMARNGLVHRAGPYKRYRYFMQAEHAQQHTTRLQLRQASSTARAAQQATATTQPQAAATSQRTPPAAASRHQLSTAAANQDAARLRTPTGKPAPVVVRQAKPTAAQQEVHIPENVRRTVAPAPPCRFAVPNPEKFKGVFSSMARGSYFPSDSAVARAYEARAGVGAAA